MDRKRKMPASNSCLLLILMLNVLVHSSSTPEVKMYHIEEGPRSIGSNATVVSEMHNGHPASAVSLYIEASSRKSLIAAASYSNWSDVAAPDYFYVADLSDFVPGVSLRPGVVDSLTREITWYFNNLPANYSHLNLTTVMETQGFFPISSQLVLCVSSCPVPDIRPTYQQSSSFNITSSSPGHFNDEGNCSCREKGQVLFNVDGTRAKGIAVCGADTNWTGCNYVQCWSPPQDIEAIQRSYDVNDPDPFNCNFRQGFPPASDIQYKLNNVMLPQPYILKSIDNGKNLSCKVSSKFTEAVSADYESLPLTITVYYPPENSALSESSPIINVNQSKLLNFSFLANPENGVVEISIQDYPGSFHWTKIYSENVYHIYEINVTVNSEQDYGSYVVCASTQSPAGFDYDILTVRNLDLQQPPTSPSDLELSSLEIGLICGIIMLVLIIVLILLLFHRRTGKDTDDGNRKAPAITKASKGTGNSNYVPDPTYEEIESNAGSKSTHTATSYDTVIPSFNY